MRNFSFISRYKLCEMVNSFLLITKANLIQLGDYISISRIYFCQLLLAMKPWYLFNIEVAFSVQL